MRLNHLLAALFALAVVATPVSVFANEHHAAKTEHHEATHTGEHHEAKATEHHEAAAAGEHHEGAEHHKPEATHK